METIPRGLNDIDLRFVIRHGQRVLQFRRATFAEHQHLIPNYHTGETRVNYVWGEWKDVRIEIHGAENAS